MSPSSVTSPGPAPPARAGWGAWIARAGRGVVLGPVLAVLALAHLYHGPLHTGFIADDYAFLEHARAHPGIGSVLRPGAIGNYYRPLSRQLYFAALAPLGGGQPYVFHVANFALFLAALALLLDLLVALMPPAPACVGALYFSLLPLQRVDLTWVSCAQDLLASALVLGAFALYRRGRTGAALGLALGAVASKEIALALPVALIAWDVLIARRSVRASLARAWPFVALSAGWGVLALAVARAAAPAGGVLHFDAVHVAAGCVHEAQSLLGLEHPAGMARALLAHGPALLPLALLLPLAAWLPPGPAGGSPSARGAWMLACAWLLAFGIVAAPLAGIWSAYFYTVPAVGGAILAGLAARRGPRAAWLVGVPILLWWHAASSSTRAFAVSENPWCWTARVTNGYLERASRLGDILARGLRTIEPAPPHGARLFFATLPPWAAFQAGDGARIRALYRDPSLASYFISQFDASTAGGEPCRFYWWDGTALEPLYRNAADPLFQVGADLLLLDRPAGAAHALRRALAEGGRRADDLYWLGWAELWSGRREEAESAWKSLGAADDTLRWNANMAAARRALISRRDTLECRRSLMEAIRYGIGRPEPHGALGGLLLSSSPKYALLELKVATFLNPDDWLSRRALLGGLLDARLEESARHELEALMSRHPELGADPTVMRARRALGSGRGSDVVEY